MRGPRRQGGRPGSVRRTERAVGRSDSGYLEDLVVVYDITDDRRRQKVHKVLKDFGRPVQYSVFEARLTREDQVRLQIALERLIDGAEDSVVFYYQCGHCRERAIRLGTAEDPFPIGLTIL